MNFNWKNEIYKNTFSLKVLGLWPKNNETYNLNAYSVYASLCITSLLCAHSFAQTINIFFILDDLEAFSQSIFVTLSCVGTVAKTYYLLKNMQSLKELFARIDDGLFQPNEDQRLLVAPSVKSWQRFYLLFQISCYSTTFFWSSYPILDKWTAEHKLPFLAWYPYDFAKSPLYELTYAHQLLGRQLC